MAYWYDGAAVAATRSPVIALFWCLIKFTSTTTTTTSIYYNNLKLTSPGYDDIHPKIIKQLSTFIALPLTHIINTSVVTGVVP